MKKLVLILGLLFFVQGGSAPGELVWQVRGGDYSRDWREAGSLFLQGLSNVFEGLAAVESQKPHDAGAAFKSAVAKIEGAQLRYSSLSDQGAATKITPTLSQERMAKIKEIFATYGSSLPQSERDAARLASKELSRYLSNLREHMPGLATADVEAGKVLIRSTHGVLELSIAVNDLMVPYETHR